MKFFMKLFHIDWLQIGALINMFTDGGNRLPPPLKLKNPNLFSALSIATGSSFTDHDLMTNKNTNIY